LQELVYAAADLRVVVVREHVWAWRRVREEGVIDWRAAAPDGRGFVPVDDPKLAEIARAITRSLGLTMTVQDFLETASGPVFLEANPQGNWLFLTDASARVVPRLADHLRSPMSNEKETWPSLSRRVVYDLMTKRRAPSRDGVIAPHFETPEWLNDVADVPGALDVARRANDDAKHAASVAEEKAARLLQTALALMTVSLALGAFQLQYALDRTPIWILSLIPIGLAILQFALSAAESLQIDRVGLYQTAEPGDLVREGIGTNAGPLAAEERGRKLARWTAQHKHSDLMQARAWFTRGLLALIIAASLAVGLRAGTDFSTSHDSHQPPGATTPTSALAH
jgi:hypothetical protein